MIDQIFTSLDEIKTIRNNYLASFINEAARRLAKGTYSQHYIRSCLRNMAFFGNWLRRNRIPIHETTRLHARNYFAYVKPKLIGWKYIKIPSGVNLTVALIQEKFPPKKHIFHKEIERFLEHLRSNRGLRKKVLHAERFIKMFLEFAFPDGRISIKKLTPSIIRNFIESIPPTRSNDAKKRACNTLRAYFRFLDINGRRAGHLIAAIPFIPSTRRALPRELIDNATLRSLLKSIDQSTKIGKRNYAAVLCLSDLAMRIGDVANITLDDIDWRKGPSVFVAVKQDHRFLCHFRRVSAKHSLTT